MCLIEVCSPLESLSSSGWGFPSCPTGRRCPGSGRWRKWHHDSPTH